MATDPITLRKLVLTKLIYNEALLASQAKQSVIKRTMAVIGFDLAVETVLKAVITDADPSAKVERDFPVVVQQVDGILSQRNQELLGRRSILYVHKIRNDTQHEARSPTEDEVSDCRTYVRDFVRQLVEQVWGTDIGVLSLVDLVHDERAKKGLKIAHKYLAQKDYAEAVKRAHSCVWVALNRSCPPVVGPDPRHQFYRSFVVSDGEETPDSAGYETYQTFGVMYDTLMVLALGIDFSGYQRLQALTRTAVYTPLDGPSTGEVKQELTLDDAEFAVSFATTAVLQIEGSVQDMGVSFGIGTDEP